MELYIPSESSLKSEPIKSNKKRNILLGLTGFIMIVAVFLLYLFLKYPTTSPLISAEYLGYGVNHAHESLNKEIIGFLPYWDLDNSKYIRPELLSEIIFFSLTADEKGNIVKVVNGETDPGWRWWKQSVIQNLIAKQQITGGKFAVTIAMQKNATLENFLDSKSAQQNLITSVANLVDAHHLDGINVDFEYNGTPEAKYRDEFTGFSANLTSTLKKQFSGLELSLDVFPLSVRRLALYDVPKLAPLYDKVIVMSYDYYATNSVKAGPDAPMNGYSTGDFVFDIATTYQDYLAVVPKDKLIMGIPYYGYDFPVKDAEASMSATLDQNDQNGYTSILSFGRMKSDSDIKPKNCQWDNLAEETWCFYTDSQTGVGHQAWFEDAKSVGIKEDFLKQNDLAGMAIWTLGYDKGYPDLWELIQNNFTPIH